jgi:hypothetical protein
MIGRVFANWAIVFYYILFSAKVTEVAQVLFFSGNK